MGLLDIWYVLYNPNQLRHKTDETFPAKIITMGVKYCHQPSKRDFSRDLEEKDKDQRCLNSSSSSFTNT